MATTASSIRAYLDSLSQLPGSILVRNELAWQGLPPGNAGQVLTLDDEGYPSWQYGLAYNPPLQLFDGNSGSFRGQYTSIGNKVCGYLLIQRDPFAGGSPERLFVSLGPSFQGNTVRAFGSIFASDDPVIERRNKLAFIARNDAGGFGCFLITDSTPVDGNRHVIAWAFDGDAGAAVLEVDGTPDIDTANPQYIAPQPANLLKGAGSNVQIGELNNGGWYGGKMGMFGMKDAYIDDWSDFPADPNRIFQIDTATWPQWQGIPAYWSAFAAMDNHQGAAPNMTRNATVTLVPE